MVHTGGALPESTTYATCATDFARRVRVALEAARCRGRNSVRWNNVEHRDNGIRYVMPLQRHAMDDRAIPVARHQTCVARHARAALRASPGARPAKRRPARPHTTRNAVRRYATK